MIVRILKLTRKRVLLSITICYILSAVGRLMKGTRLEVESKEFFIEVRKFLKTVDFLSEEEMG